MPPERSERIRVNPSLDRPAASGDSARIRRDPFRASRAGSDSAQIAQALGSFSDTLAQGLGSFGKARAEEEMKEGKRAARQAWEDQKSYKELVEEGKIPAAANPYYKAGVQREAGRLAGQRFESYLIQKYGNKFGSDSDSVSDAAITAGTTMEEYDQFAQEALDEYVENQIGSENRTEAFDTGFQTRAQAAISKYRQQYADTTSSRLKGQDAATLARTTFNDAREMLSAGKSPDEVREHFQAKLDKWVQELDSSNARGRINAVVLGLANLAQYENDTQALEVIDGLKGGPVGQEERPGVIGSPRIQKAVRDARNSIARNLNRGSPGEIRAENQRQREVREVRVEVGEEMYQAENPAEVDLSPYIDRLQAAGVPNATKKMQDLREAHVNEMEYEDPQVVNEIKLGVLRGNITRADLTTKVANQEIHPDTAKELRGWLDDVEDSEFDPMENTYMKQGVKELGDLFGIEGIVTQELSELQARLTGREQEALTYFRKNYAEWLMDRGENGGWQHLQNNNVEALLDKKDQIKTNAVMTYANDQRKEWFLEVWTGQDATSTSTPQR